MLNDYWELWQDCLEEAEDKNFQPLTQMAQTNYRCFFVKGTFIGLQESIYTFKSVTNVPVYKYIHFA